MVHVGAGEDACCDGDKVLSVIGDGRGRGRGRQNALHQLPRQFWILAVFENTFHHLPPLLHQLFLLFFTNGESQFYTSYIFEV